jgi:hypothetical protein
MLDPVIHAASLLRLMLGSIFGTKGLETSVQYLLFTTVYLMIIRLDWKRVCYNAHDRSQIALQRTMVCNLCDDHLIDKAASSDVDVVQNHF